MTSPTAPPPHRGPITGVRVTLPSLVPLLARRRAGTGGSAVAASAILLVALATSACGGAAGDLIAVEVSGGSQEAPVVISVSDDGHARCGTAPLEPIPSQALLDAREVERELAPLAATGTRFPAPGTGAREYVFRMRDGAVRFGEGAPDLPPALPQAVLLERELERLLC